MHRVSAVFTALLLGAAGCSFSSVDPDASVHVSGRALDADGKPLAHTKVLLFKQADIGEVIFGTVLTVGSLATVCLLPDSPAICNKARTATTGSDGGYSFDLSGKDTQGTLGTESTLNVVFAGPVDQGSTTISFTADEADISLPDARLWRAQPHATSGSSIHLSWSPLPASAGPDRSYSAQAFEKGPENASEFALWSQPAKGRAATIDARILENGSGSVAVSAHSGLPGATGAGHVSASYLSKKVAARSNVGTPVSRGARCAPVSGTAPATNGAYTRCGATDGDLTSPAHLTGNGVVDGVVIDLGRARPVDLVVARGFAGQVLVETSTDGKAFGIVATSSGTVALSVPGRPTARYVRLRSPAGLDESLSSEVSVWS
jgi:hypothetical protein